MVKAVINIKADKEVKKNAKKLAEDLGLSLSDILNASLRNFIRTREISFSQIPQMTPELERLLNAVEQDIETGKNLSPVLKNAAEIENRLNSL